MPAVDVLDDTFVRAPRALVRRETAGRWAGWLPGLDLQVDEDRGDKGTRWLVTGCDRGDLAGTAEVWLEEVPGGTVAHLYVRLDPVPDPVAVASAGGRWTQARRDWDRRRLPDRVRRTWKRGLHGYKDGVERRGTPTSTEGTA